MVVDVTHCSVPVLLMYICLETSGAFVQYNQTKQGGLF